MGNPTVLASKKVWTGQDGEAGLDETGETPTSAQKLPSAVELT